MNELIEAAYSEGYYAFRLGWYSEDCPYQETDPRRLAWLAGFGDGYLSAI